MTHTNWETKAGTDKKRGKKVWTHTAPHAVNDGEVDGDVSFPDELLAKFDDDIEVDETDED